MSGLKYRAEIDGLRSVAVIPVILFHAGIGVFSGGFVGVDVFFVISGFLITSIILRELEEGRFSIWRFYERRARRILPALFFVLAATTIAAYALSLPYELADYGRWLNGVIFFVSNIVFWREAGYFAGASELNPLLHTWSLAVEEQFYIFFPPFLWLIWRWRMRAVWVILGLATFGSLILADLLSTRAVGANFYLLPTRAWELLSGSLLAMYLTRKPQPVGMTAEVTSLGGLIGIIGSVLVYDKATPFPSFYTLVPVIGTVAVLLAASPRTVTGRVLGWAPMVALGLISYSAYLWHQPLFAFARLLAPENHPPMTIMLLLSAAAVVLAWLTWRYVEAPFRNKDRCTRRQIFGGAALGGAVFAAVGVVFVVTGGFIQRYPASEIQIVNRSNASHGDYVRDGYMQANNAPLSASLPNLVLIGDSFSQDFYNVIKEAGAFGDYAISARYIPARCQLVFGDHATALHGFIAAEDQRMCEERRISQADVDLIGQADVIIFAANWQPWAAQAFGASLAAMDISAATQVFVVGPKVFLENRRAILQSHRDSGLSARAQQNAEAIAANNALRQQVPDGGFVDILGAFCAQGCPVFSDAGDMLSYDGRHLTPQGAATLGKVIFAQEPLRAFR